MLQPTKEMNDFMKSAFGVDPEKFASPSAKSAKAAGDGAGKTAGGKEAAGKEGAGKEGAEGAAKKFSHTFPVASKTIKAAGGRLEITLGLFVQASCEVAMGGGGETSIDAKKLASALGRFVVGWTDKVAMPSVSAGGGLFKSLELKRSGMGLVGSAETQTSIGHFSLEFTVVKLEKAGEPKGEKKGAEPKAGEKKSKVSFKAAEASATLIPHKVVLPDTVIEGVKVTKLTLEAGGKVDLAPNWPVVLAKWAAVEAGEDALLEAGEAAAGVVGAEIVIAGSLVAVGLTTIFGTLYSLAQGAQIGDIAIAAKLGGDKAKQGFKLAMSGYKQPSDPLMAAGYQAGLQNRAALIEKVKKQYPDAAEDDIKKEIAGVADEAVKQAKDTIERAMKVGLWDGYLATNKRMLLSGDAKWAFTACFGDNPKDGDPEWKKYLDQHSMGSKI